MNFIPIINEFLLEYYLFVDTDLAQEFAKFKEHGQFNELPLQERFHHELHV
jgi:hypothetical protein